MSTVTKSRRTRNISGSPERRRIDVQAVRNVLETIAATDPAHRDHRIEDERPSTYIHGGKPTCLVAVALTRLGFRDTILWALQQERPVGVIGSPGVKVAESRHPALKKLTPAARRLLGYVQDAQDRGEAWGRIVREAFSRRPWVPAKWERSRKPWLFPDLT